MSRGQEFGVVRGSARAILVAERVALNFMQRMSGIATATAAFVAALSGTRARVLETRKTAPGLRLLDKWAVLAGGGANHRMGLFDMMMVKDNHIAAAGGMRCARARQCGRGGGGRQAVFGAGVGLSGGAFAPLDGRAGLGVDDEPLAARASFSPLSLPPSPPLALLSNPLHSQAVERAEAFIAARGLTGSMRVEVETRTLEEVDEAVAILEGGGAPHVTR